MQFSDISIVPQYSKVLSRADVNLEYSIQTKFSNRTLKGVPVFVANMDTTGTFAMAKAVNEYGFFTCLHKYYSLESLISFFREDYSERAFVTVGLGDKEINDVCDLIDLGLVDKVCFDVANGYIQSFHDKIELFRNRYKDVIIMAGNVCTKEGVVLLKNVGVDIVKCGIANGSACDTKNKAGICIPQPDTILGCTGHGLPIVSDGGCKVPADIVKALALGAKFVMCGGMFAGHEECDGEWEYNYEYKREDGTTYELAWNDHHVHPLTGNKSKRNLKFYGMSSKAANIKYNGGLKEYRASEGKEFYVPYKGFVREACMDICGSLASACTYSNAANLNDFHNNVEWRKI